MWQQNVVMDLSGIYAKIPFWKELACASEYTRYVDLTDLEGTTFFCSTEAADAIRKQIAPFPLEAVHWIDSGDYHYISLFWLERMTEPFVLVMMDHHSDLKESVFGAGLLSCGSWVLESLRTLPLLKKVILIGPEDGEVLEAETEYREKILWIREAELKARKEELIAALKEETVYLSFDKDVLDETICETGWTQGNMTKETAWELISAVKEHARICGIDICGEAVCQRGEVLGEKAEKNAALNQWFLERLFDESHTFRKNTDTKMS